MVRAERGMDRQLVSVRLSPDLYKALRYLSVDTDKTIAVLMEEGISMVLAKYQKKGKR